MLKCPKCNKDVLYTTYTKESGYEACDECRSVIVNPYYSDSQSLKDQIADIIRDRYIPCEYIIVENKVNQIVKVIGEQIDKKLRILHKEQLTGYMMALEDVNKILYD